MKYVLVTGGVVSGLGKGVTASSIGLLLKSCGLRVTSIKIDPYLNTDAGTMSPFEHGEVFVLDDGGEVDLDLGNYERFLDITLTRENNITTGKIYQVSSRCFLLSSIPIQKLSLQSPCSFCFSQSVIDKERKGDYLGKTVQVVPHITDEIQEWIERAAMIPVDGKEGPADVCVIELGGTIGDIESMPFIEALGQFSYRVGTGNFCLVHVSLVPVLSVVGEQKTKPTQHSVRGLRGLGLTPNILACRSTKALDDNVKEKLSQFCHVPAENIVTLYDVPNIWHIPLLLRDQKAHEAILKGLNLLGIAREPDLTEWTARTKNYDMLHDPVKIAMVGKYVGLTDSYLSVLKSYNIHYRISSWTKDALRGAVHHRKKLVVEWVEASHLEDITAEEASLDFPGGFGDRGVQGKILAAKYARESNVPFLGICLGMQIAVIEYARSVLGLHNANSIEFDPKTSNPCVIFMPEGSKTHMGGTMRLGTRRTYLKVPDCKSAKLYGDATFVDERHRHRYEVNPDMISELEAAGMSFVGRDESGRRMEIVELPSHPFFIGVQFHPEFKSRPGKPSALFSGERQHRRIRRNMGLGIVRFCLLHFFLARTDIGFTYGLIAASCGELDELLNKSSHVSKVVGSEISNGKATYNGHQNGSYFNALNGSLNGVCVNGNGVHH
ncbi:hypothetical protein GOBAR_DD26896 [Gossypium barbadense]|nr:hypothetical protein GOBAR_DD26896 [Gossypium barbadense]